MRPGTIAANANQTVDARRATGVRVGEGTRPPMKSKPDLAGECQSRRDDDRKGGGPPPLLPILHRRRCLPLLSL